jgi:hypothetical protein
MARFGRTLSKDQIAIKHGYRSGLEDIVAQQLADCGVKAQYEPFRISYTQPERKAHYTPDFVLPNGIIIETKGRFEVKDRQKHVFLKEQHPDLDIRFVFTNPNNRISKGSPTTYGLWCKKHGFLFATKLIPTEWLNEPPDERRLMAVRQFENESKRKN